MPWRCSWMYDISGQNIGTSKNECDALSNGRSFINRCGRSVCCTLISCVSTLISCCVPLDEMKEWSLAASSPQRDMLWCLR
jgi:hypothetical protein